MSVNDKENNSRYQKYRQHLNMGLLAVVIGLIVYAVDYFLLSGSKPASLNQEDKSQGRVNLDMGSFAVQGEKLWQNNFDERLAKEKAERDEQLNKLNAVIGNLEENLRQEKEKNQAGDDIAVLKEQVEWLKQEMRSNPGSLKEEVLPVNIGSTRISEQQITEAGKEMDSYIPAGSFISGILRGGISVSTGTNAPAEPIPIFIMVTGYGDLPKSFKADLTTCRLIASGYGNLANERVIARVEMMSCTDVRTGLVTETEVVGVVHSIDSKNGIKGTVVSMSDKHINNAMVGGFLSGFANTAKRGDNLMFNGTLGTITQKRPSFKDKLGEDSLSGAGTAIDRIADYHLKMAEATSPVIEVPGGARISIFFSKGVFLGSKNIKEAINRERR